MNGNPIDKVYLYGLDECYRIVKYEFLWRTDLGIRVLVNEAIRLRTWNPAVKTVFAIDNSHEVYTSARDVLRKDWIDNRVAFKDLLEREGVKII